MKRDLRNLPTQLSLAAIAPSSFLCQLKQRISAERLVQRLLSEPAPRVQPDRTPLIGAARAPSSNTALQIRKMPRHFARREDRMKSLISPVQRRPPVLPGPTPREDDATSTAPVSGERSQPPSLEW